jgi:integrase
MTQPAYTPLLDAIDAGHRQEIFLGGSRVSVLPIAKKNNRRVLRVVWGPRGFRQTRETTSAENAKELVKSIFQRTADILTAAKAVPDPEVQRIRMALAELPGVSVEELVASYKHHLAAVKDGPGRAVSVLVEDLLSKTADRGVSPRHLQTLRSHLRRFADAYRVPIGMILPEDVDTYLAQFTNPKTRNNHRISLIALFNHARRRGDLPHREMTAVDKTEAAKVIRHEPEVLSRENLESLLHACEDKRLLAFLVIGAFAGCRTSEIQRLCWGDITPEGIFLTPEITKTNRRRVVEISENLAAWLAELPRGEDGDPVTYKSAPHLYESLRNLCSQQGVTWVDNGLRHGYVSHHLELHGDATRTSKNTGHSLRELETDYLKLVSKSDAAAWFSIFPKNPHPEPEPCQTNCQKINAE